MARACAVVAGAKTIDELAEWGQRAPNALLAVIGVRHHPIVLVRDNLNVHKAAGLRVFAEDRDWLTIYYLPPYAPDQPRRRRVVAPTTRLALERRLRHP